MSQDVEQGMSNPRGRKSVSWRRDPVILARLRDVERRHLAGETNVAIAEALDVDEITIRRDLERLRELWLERTQADQDENRSRVLAELEDVRVRALAAAEHDERMERAVLLDEPFEQTICPGGVDHSPFGNYPPLVEGANDRLKCSVPHVMGRRVRRDDKGTASFRGNKAAALAQARQATMDKAKILGIVVDKVAPTNAAGEDLPLDELAARFSRRQAQQTDGDPA